MYTHRDYDYIKKSRAKNGTVEIKLYVTKDKKEEYKKQADKEGVSLNQFIINIVDEKIGG